MQVQKHLVFQNNHQLLLAYNNGRREILGHFPFDQKKGERNERRRENLGGADIFVLGLGNENHKIV